MDNNDSAYYEDTIADLTKEVEVLNREIDDRDDVIQSLRDHINDINLQASELYNFINTRL